MIHFKEMMNVFNKNGIFEFTNTSIEKSSFMSHSNFIQTYKAAKLFVCQHDFRPDAVMQPDYVHEGDFDLPFDVVAFEIAPQVFGGIFEPRVPICSFNASDSNADSLYRVICCLYNELEDTFFCYFLLISKKTGETYPFITVVNKDSVGNGYNLYQAMRMSSEHFTKYLNSGKIGATTSKEAVLVKRKHGFETVKINQIIYIYKKNYEKTGYEANDKGEKIEFSHRFFRRGHWRKTDNPMTIGKDRHNERNQYGRTWVMESIVGDENLPLIDNKIRVVK